MRTEPLTFDREAPLADEFLLAPYVWRDGDAFRVLIRIVPREDDPAKKISRIHPGRSHDGLRFAIAASPALAPSDDPGSDDQDGCEDPSLAYERDTYYAYYSGWNQHRAVGQLLLATGSDVTSL